MNPELDPSRDPEVRRRVNAALNDVLFTAKDVLWRYTDADGMYVEPSGVADGGDVTGVINAGMVQVVNRLQAQLDEAREVMRTVYAEIDDYKRSYLGDGYNPAPRKILER
jgi:hypothetical protein